MSDLSVPDFDGAPMPVDQAAPDLAAPDQAAPDLAAPDQAAPDQAAPDQAAFDLHPAAGSRTGAAEDDLSRPAHVAMAGRTSPATDAAGDTSLLALVDRLAAMLERSDLLELEVEAGGTGLVLRKPGALVTMASPSPAGEAGPRADGARAARPGPSASGGGAAPGAAVAVDGAGDARLTVRAPLTGIFYSAPGPGSPPFVALGREVVVGQVIGLIEAMKLFNEIKSDQAGRVVRVIAEDGALVKAKQPLIEVVPL